MAKDILVALKQAPLFAALDEQEIQALAAHVVRKAFQRGEQLFSEGDACTGLYLVALGRVRIFKLSPAGREQILAIEGTGSSFAELPVFDGGTYPASASALEDTQVLFVSRKDFQAFCRSHPEVALKVIAVVGTRLRRLVGIIEELSFTTVRQRLITVLLRLAHQHGVSNEGQVSFELTNTQQDLASELGTVRELVSRNLGRLQAEGLIELRGRRVIVKDFQGLKLEQDSARGDKDV